MDADVFVLPEEWQFYQCELQFGGSNFVVVAAEPHGSCACPTITVETTAKDGQVVMFLTAVDAAELWTALGHAIRNSTGADPKPVRLLKND